MIFLVANSSQCMEIESPDIMDALDQGMILLKESPKYGNVSGVEKPKSIEELVELKRKLTISIGDLFEYFGYQPYESIMIKEYLEQIKGQYVK